MIEAQPLVDLKQQLLAELRKGRAAVDQLKQQKMQLEDTVEALEQIASLDKPAVSLLLQHLQRQPASKVWGERLIAFGFGIAASVVASYVFEYLNRL
jgi:hypothetical protein